MPRPRERRAARRARAARSTLLALPNLCRDHRAVPLFVAEALWHDFHLSSGFANVVPVSFAGYSKPQLVAILCRDAPAALAALGGGGSGGRRRSSGSGGSSGGGAAAVDEAAFRAFAGHVVEYFADLCRDVQELRYQCRELFPTFVEPIVKGRVAAGDVSRLMARAKPFLLAQLPKVYAHDGTLSSTNTDDSEPIQHATLGLPTCAKFLVVAAFLASRFPPRVDSAFFCTARAKAGGRRTKRPAPADEPHAFTLERLLAIYRAMQPRRAARRRPRPTSSSARCRVAAGSSAPPPRSTSTARASAATPRSPTSPTSPPRSPSSCRST